MKLIISKKMPSLVFLSVFSFFAVFTPPLFGGVPMSYLTLLVMLVYIGYNVLLHGNMYTMRKDSLRFLYSFVPFLIYVFLCMVYRIIVSGKFNEFSAYVFNFWHVLVTIVFITVTYEFFTCYWNRHKNLNRKDFVFMFLAVGLLQAFCMLISFFNEGIQSFFVGFVLRNGTYDIMQEAVLREMFRAFGFSSYYFDALGYVMAGIGLIVFVEGLYTRSSFLLFSAILIAGVSALTARTGIVLAFIGFSILFYYNFLERVKLSWQTIIKGICIVIIIVGSFYFSYQNLSNHHKWWLEYAFSVTQDLLLEQKIGGIYEHVFLTDVIFPDDVLFGIGATPEKVGYFDNTGHVIDNGYIQVIWRFGLIGLLLLFGGYVSFFRRLRKGCASVYVKSLIVAFEVCIVLYYVKIYPLNRHTANIIYFVVPLFFFYFDNYFNRSNIKI